MVVKLSRCRFLTLDNMKEVLHGVLVASESLFVVFGFVFLRCLAGQIYSFLRTNDMKENKVSRSCLMKKLCNVATKTPLHA